MPLSEQEQQVLDQMERALAQDDPKFASHMAGSERYPSRRQWLVMILGAACALGLVLAAVATQHWALAVGGMALLAASVWWGTRRPATSLTLVGDPRRSRTVNSRAKGASRPGAMQRTGTARGAGSTRGKAGSRTRHFSSRVGHKRIGAPSFMERMEERWESRRNQW